MYLYISRFPSPFSEKVIPAKGLSETIYEAPCLLAWPKITHSNSLLHLFRVSQTPFFTELGHNVHDILGVG